MSKCVFCQKDVEVVDRVGVRDDCPHCEMPLHCCFQCKFYDQSSFHECKERVQYRVEHKDKGNYCDLFAFGREATEKVADKADVKAKLNALFKN